MPGMSFAERLFIADGIAQDLRNDGRAREDYRPMSLELGVLVQSTGSARLRLGRTEVVASVKAELGTPSPDFPDQGRLEITVAISSVADPYNEGRGGEDYVVELTRTLERALLGGPSGAGAAVDLSKLGIVAGQRCWVLCIDTLVLSVDGNIVDAASIAIKAALADTMIPTVVFGEGSAEDQADFDISDETGERLDTSACPLIVTLTQVGRFYVVDTDTAEESQMSSALSLAVNAAGAVCGVTKRGSTGVDPSVITDMYACARRVGRKLLDQVEGLIAGAQMPSNGGDGGARG